MKAAMASALGRSRIALERQRNDDGQVTTALVMVFIIGILAVTLRVMLPIGQANEQVTQAHAAADAAALAAAKQITTDLPAAIAAQVARARTPADLLNVLAGVGCGLGAGSAQSYAAMNHADIITYCYAPFSDRIDVRVRSRQTAQTGAQAQARAVVRLGPRLGPCTFTNDPAAPPVVPPGPVGPPIPSPGTLRCGDLRLHFTFDAAGLPVLDSTLTDFVNQFKPALIA